MGALRVLPGRWQGGVSWKRLSEREHGHVGSVWRAEESGYGGRGWEAKTVNKRLLRSWQGSACLSGEVRLSGRCVEKRGLAEGAI